MTRSSEITRERILKTAVRLIAERGYEATSIRTLAAKARVNQAAINYHFIAQPLRNLIGSSRLLKK